MISGSARAAGAPIFRSAYKAPSRTRGHVSRISDATRGSRAGFSPRKPPAIQFTWPSRRASTIVETTSGCDGAMQPRALMTSRRCNGSTVFHKDISRGTTVAFRAASLPMVPSNSTALIRHSTSSRRSTSVLTTSWWQQPIFCRRSAAQRRTRLSDAWSASRRSGMVEVVRSSCGEYLRNAAIAAARTLASSSFRSRINSPGSVGGAGRIHRHARNEAERTSGSGCRRARSSTGPTRRDERIRRLNPFMAFARIVGSRSWSATSRARTCRRTIRQSHGPSLPHMQQSQNGPWISSSRVAARTRRSGCRILASAWQRSKPRSSGSSSKYASAAWRAGGSPSASAST